MSLKKKQKHKEEKLTLLLNFYYYIITYKEPKILSNQKKDITTQNIKTIRK